MTAVYFFSFLIPSKILEKRKQKIIYSFMCCTNILHYFGLSVRQMYCAGLLVDS